jgi:large subunit ribosomal protein L25
MTTYPTLTGTLRAGAGTNAARKLRQQGLMPATVYGHGAPVSLVLNQHHFSLVARESQSGSQLVNLSIDGTDGGLVLVKAVQRNIINKTPIHVDFQRISLQEKLNVTVSVVLEGDAAGVLEGGRLEIIMHALHLQCAAGVVPDNLTHDVSAMQIGDTLEAGAFALPDGCTLLDRPEECVALIRQPMRTAATATAAAADTASE